MLKDSTPQVQPVYAPRRERHNLVQVKSMEQQ
jgi:hypothetical protein